MAVLLLAQQQRGQLSPSTLQAVSACRLLGAELDVVLLGDGALPAAQAAAQIAGVRTVYHAEGLTHALAESVEPVLRALSDRYQHWVFIADTQGKNIAPRLAAQLDCACISEVTQVLDAQHFVHPIYAGNVMETVEVLTEQVVLTVRTTAFPFAEVSGGQAAVEALPQSAEAGAQSLSRWVSESGTEGERPELTSARVIVSGGRALGSAEQFNAVLTPLADQLNAAIGASRAAVDAGYAPNDWQVGQTGKMVAPELYIAVGISGAIQHAAGIKDAQTIVAINKDPDAAIFQIADYGLVADLFEAVPELTEALSLSKPDIA